MPQAHRVFGFAPHGAALAEILLRLPPDDPACLLRASLVCKAWHRVLSDSAFPRRYREFHRTLPLLGFLHGMSCRFIPVTKRTPFLQPPLVCLVLDCRHGRVLLNKEEDGTRGALTVWDPITGDHKVLPELDITRFPTYSGAVLCAVAGCDHSGCHGGPFLVIFVGNRGMVSSAWVYSSEAAAWSAPASVEHIHEYYFDDANRGATAIVRGGVCFIFHGGTEILKYDLGKHCLSVIDSPCEDYHSIILMPIEDVSLGFAGIQGDSTLHLWSRQVDSMGVARWALYRVIHLEKLVDLGRPYGYAHAIRFPEEGMGVILLSQDGIFLFELRSGRLRKLSECYYDLIPFMSFYIPDFACRKRLAITNPTEEQTSRADSM